MQVKEFKTNQFTISACDFFTTTPRGNYDGSDPDCGDAINTCGTLALDADGDGTADILHGHLPNPGRINAGLSKWYISCY